MFYGVGKCLSSQSNQLVEIANVQFSQKGLASQLIALFTAITQSQHCGNSFQLKNITILPKKKKSGENGHYFPHQLRLFQ